MIRKRNPERSRKYLDWVKTLDCAVCLQPADDPHHGQDIGLGGGLKPSDFFTVPLCRRCHAERHKSGTQVFDYQGGEAEAILRTLDRALHEGIIEVKV